MADDMMAVPVPSEELEHYGLKGMSWYKHIFGEWQKHAQYANGMDDPDAPEKKTRAERRAEAYEEGKQRALQSGSATDILKYKGDLTNQEMQAAVNRLNLERQLSEVMAKENYVKTGWDKADEIFDRVGKVGNYVGNTANLIGNTNRLITNGKELLDFAKGLTKSGKEKREAIEKGDLNDIKKHINEFSTKEREDIAKRLKFEDNINERLANRKPKEDDTELDEDGKPKEKDPIETMNSSLHTNSSKTGDKGSGDSKEKTSSASESFHKTVDKGRQEEVNKQKTARERRKEELDKKNEELLRKEAEDNAKRQAEEQSKKYREELENTRDQANAKSHNYSKMTKDMEDAIRNNSGNSKVSSATELNITKRAVDKQRTKDLEEQQRYMEYLLRKQNQNK